MTENADLKLALIWLQNPAETGPLWCSFLASLVVRMVGKPAPAPNLPSRLSSLALLGGQDADLCSPCSTMDCDLFFVLQVLRSVAPSCKLRPTSLENVLSPEIHTFALEMHSLYIVTKVLILRCRERNC